VRIAEASESPINGALNLKGADVPRRKRLG